jgi:hypothetical protein
MELDRTDLVLGGAIVSTIEEDHQRAATLLAWVGANTFGIGLPPRSSVNYMLYVHYRDLLRAALSPDDAKRARDEGAKLSFDDVLALAFPEEDA